MKMDSFWYDNDLIFGQKMISFWAENELFSLDRTKDFFSIGIVAIEVYVQWHPVDSTKR